MQRRNTQLEGAQAEIQVFAEFALRNRIAQIFVGCSDDLDVQGHRALRTQTGQCALLQHPQQLGLQMHGQLANFIEEQGSALGLFKQAAVVFHRASERAFFMAEEQVFHHVLGQRSAVQADKWATRHDGRFMQHTRQHLFTRPGWAFNQHIHIGQRHALGQGQQIAADRIHIDHIAHRRHGRSLGDRCLGVFVLLGLLHRLQRSLPGGNSPVIGGDHMQSTGAHSGHGDF